MIFPSTSTFKTLLAFVTFVLTIINSWFHVFAGGICTECPKNVVIVEEHSEALCEWYKNEIKDMILVHIDAHHDFYSPQIKIEHNVSRLRDLLDNFTCEQIKPRTLNLVHTDAIYTIGDFIYPSFQLGIIKELWWVIASDKPLSLSEFEPFKQWLKNYWEFPDSFIQSLSWKDQIVWGEFDGMPIRIVPIQNLPTFDEPVLLDIDIDYLFELYDSPIKQSMIQLSEWLFEIIKSKRLESDFVTIACSVFGGHMPLRFKYVADYLYDLMSNSKISNSYFKNLELQASVEYFEYTMDFKNALSTASRLVALQPNSPVPEYNLARIYLAMDELEQAIVHLEKAVRKDSSYKYGYISLAGELSQHGKMDEMNLLLKEGYNRYSDFIDIGMLFASHCNSLADYFYAIEIYSHLIKVDDQVPELYAGLARSQYLTGLFEEAGKNILRYKQLAHHGTKRSLIIRQWKELQKGISIKR